MHYYDYIIVGEREINKGVLMLEVVEVLRENVRENEAVVMVKTIVDEFDFPEYIVTCKGPFPVEKVFSEYVDAEKYYNDVYYDRSYSISKW